MQKPPILITKSEARRFLLAHHGLYPPRNLVGKGGVMEFIRRVGCIQYDPINIVGTNPDLVLQARIKNYKADFLTSLLYSERRLIDGWDKMASVYQATDWSYFLRHKKHVQEQKSNRRPKKEILVSVLKEIDARGPLSSLEFKNEEKVDWAWGPTKIARAALEQLYAEGRLGIDHRLNNRRYFDRIENLLPSKLINQSDPFNDVSEYQEWHVHRRVGSMGLAHANAGEYWFGILGVKSQERKKILKQLSKQGKLIAIQVNGLGNQSYYIRAEDLPSLDMAKSSGSPPYEASIIAPLDNLIWNRKSTSLVFDFDYIWEIYKPPKKRKYGYYVLPVLYRDYFIARFEPNFNKQEQVLTIANWWWERGITPDEKMKSALIRCFNDFATYLDANNCLRGEIIQEDHTLSWIDSILNQ